jgi:ubiquinone/menaquinone biosynthesis C-methylase UbiE
MVAEYFSDVTGAHVSGMDYIPDAIAQARERTAAKRRRLSFHVGNLDNLPFPPGSFDTLISFDTLYMPNDLDNTLTQMRRLLTPGGRMAIFYTHMLWEPGSSPESLQADKTPLGQALGAAGLTFNTQDFSAETYVLMQRKRQIAEAMRADFAGEGRSFLYDHLATESEGNPAPFDPQTSTMSRYLYIVQM